MSFVNGFSTLPSLTNVAASPNLSKNEHEFGHSGINRLNMNEIVEDIEDYGDTSSLESAIEIEDFTKSYFKSYKERINVLMKEDDDGEDAVSGCEQNWIMKKVMKK